VEVFIIDSGYRSAEAKQDQREPLEL